MKYAGMFLVIDIAGYEERTRVLYMIQNLHIEWFCDGKQ